jgi:TonB family protein
MKKLRHYRHDLLLPALAIVCTVVTVRAQQYAPGPDDLPAVIGRKQAEGLALTRLAPEYPPVAKVNYIQGYVHLELTVDGAGDVTNVHVLDGNAMLAASALQATRRWIYHPLSTPAGPAGFITTVKLKFTLRSAAAELTPQQAERDFERQVKPPQMVLPPEGAPREEVVHMRLLVNDQGEVVDREALPMGRARLKAAWETVRGWTFRPAHWGNLPIASYFDVDVPVSAPPVTRAAANTGSR